MKKICRIIAILFISFVSLLAIFLNLNVTNQEEVITTSKMLFEIPLHLNIKHFLVFIFIFYFYDKCYFKGEKFKLSISILSFVLSIGLLLGYSFEKTNSFDLIFLSNIQIIKSIIKLLGNYFIIYVLIKKLLSMIKVVAKKNKKIKSKCLSFIFDKHPNICIPIILIILWSPIIILSFPGVISWDAVTQIYQLLGRYQEFHVNIINPNVALNNHHPILSTLLIGLFINIGKLVNSVDFGIFLYILSQTGLLIYTILYSFKVITKMKLSNKVKLIVLIFYALCPIFYVFTTNVLKDVLFSIFMFYYVLLLIEMLVDSEVLKKKSYILKLIITIFFVIMIRNNGIYSVMISYPFLFFIIKNHRKRLLIGLLLPVIIFISLNKVVYPVLEISPGSIKEALSMPFQQTARTLNEGKEYSEYDLQKINKVLDAEYIKNNYNPNLSDPVKNTFNKKASKQDLMNYFKIWSKYFFKYPVEYLEAGLNTTYGYWYPNKANVVGYFDIRDDFLEENPYNMKYLNYFQKQRDNLSMFYNTFLVKTPVIGTLLSAGFYNWMLLILSLFVLLSKNKKLIIPYIALITIFLTCIASPYFAIRYMLSIVYSMPILICCCIYSYKKKYSYKRRLFSYM